MKKEKLITRTIESTTANIVVFNTTTASVEKQELILAGNLSETDAEKEIRCLFENEKVYKFVMIENLEVVSKLYGVTESAFLEIAKELPPRKANETQEEE